MKKEQKPRNPYAKAFYDFCLANPDMRFWQAVRAFTGAKFILTAEYYGYGDGGGQGYEGVTDTYYWEGLDK